MKRLNINVRTEDVFHPVDKLGTFNREHLRNLFLQLNAVSTKAVACAEQCSSIPKNLVDLGLEDLKVSPAHLRNYYERIEAEAVSLSDAVANRLQATAATAHMQDGFVRQQFYKAFEISQDFGFKQFSGIRSSVIASVEAMVEAIPDEDSIEESPGCCAADSDYSKHAQYAALVSTAVVAEAFSNALHNFKYSADTALDMPNDPSIRDEAKELLYKAGE